MNRTGPQVVKIPFRLHLRLQRHNIICKLILKVPNSDIRLQCKHLHNSATRILDISLVLLLWNYLLLGSLVKQSTLCAQCITAFHQIIQLLTPLEDRLNSLVKNNLCFIQLGLNFHNRIGLRRILEPRQILSSALHTERGTTLLSSGKSRDALDLNFEGGYRCKNSSRILESSEYATRKG